MEHGDGGLQRRWSGLRWALGWDKWYEKTRNVRTSKLLAHSKLLARVSKFIHIEFSYFPFTWHRSVFCNTPLCL